MAKKESASDGYNWIISESARLGDYTNFVKIQHSGIDFRFDFAKMLPEENTLYVHARLFMSPVHAKLFMRALEENITKYERSFGTIQIKGDSEQQASGTASREVH